MRNYKRVIEQVKRTKEPAVVMSQKEPQVAIVSLDDLETLKRAEATNSARALLETAQRVRQALRDERLPADLAERHDAYLWSLEGDSPHDEPRA